MNIKEKRIMIRDYAKKLGVCATCLRKESRKDKNTCQCCSDKNTKRARIRRQKYENCSKCGLKRDEDNFKTCSKCRKKVS